MATYTTEIASDKLVSDNPIHQRLLKAYIAAVPWVKGKLLEVGCGEGRGIEVIAGEADSYLGVDKIGEVIERLQEKFPQHKFQQSVIPPLAALNDNTFDTVVSFQVIEHIKDDRGFLEEIYRVLKPNGTAILSTPNIAHTLSRNPWHIREYLPNQLRELCAQVFEEVDAKGIGGNEKVMAYHEANRKSVQRIMRWDIFDLQYKLPAAILRMPYEVLNRLNRKKLYREQGEGATSITHEDYVVLDSPENGLDLFYILKKH